ncbi:MAG: OmpA family protein, partial [Geminicoccaceae bacterium]
AQAESVAATTAALQLQLRDADTTLKQAQARVAEQDAQLTTMRADLVAARNDLASAEAQLAGKVKENEMLAAAGRDLVAGGDTLAAEFAALQQQTAGLQQELMQAREVALSSETRNQALEQELGAIVAPRALFFTQLRQALGPDSGTIVDDDRFIFSSDIVFASASAKLPPAATAEVLEIGRAVAAAAAALPDDQDWVIRIDGHTDRSTVGGRVFDSNRELAAERAVEVVRLLTKAGVPPERLAAASFGEFRPLDPGESAEAYQRNRRIELVLDEG